MLCDLELLEMRTLCGLKDSEGRRALARRGRVNLDGPPNELASGGSPHTSGDALFDTDFDGSGGAPGLTVPPFSQFHPRACLCGAPAATTRNTRRRFLFTITVIDAPDRPRCFTVHLV